MEIDKNKNKDNENYYYCKLCDCTVFRNKDHFSSGIIQHKKSKKHQHILKLTKRIQDLLNKKLEEEIINDT